MTAEKIQGTAQVQMLFPLVRDPVSLPEPEVVAASSALRALHRPFFHDVFSSLFEPIRTFGTLDILWQRVAQCNCALCEDIFPLGCFKPFLISQNLRLLEVRTGLWRSSGPTPLLKQDHLEPVAQDHIQVAFEYLQGRRVHNVPGQRCASAQ